MRHLCVAYCLGATILFTSKGIVFFQAGEEMLRSKPNPKAPHGFDHNSYKSSDEVNNLRWENLKEGSYEYEMFKYYAGLAAIRTSFDIFTDKSASFNVYEHNDNSGYNIIIDDGNGGKAVVVINPHAYAIKFTLDGTYHLICNGSSAGTESLGTRSGEISVPGTSGIILVNDKILNSAK